jgi:YegS/Rv2252/BmrU family lipid kinase
MAAPGEHAARSSGARAEPSAYLRCSFALGWHKPAVVKTEVDLGNSNAPAAPCAAPSRSMACIINGSAKSEKASALRERVQDLFEARGVTVRMLAAEEGADLTDLANSAAKSDVEVVIAGGGDGTINAVASALVDSPIALGVLPLGTLNHFAKDMGVPSDLEQAVDAVLAGHRVRVDVGTVNGRIFLNNSSLGLYPAIVRQREELQSKGRSKWGAFAISVLYALRRYQRLYVRLESDKGAEGEEETPFLFIGNNQYEVSGLHIGERAHLNAGALWVYRAPRASRASLLRMALAALLGRRDRSQLQVMSVKSLCIRAQKGHIHVAIDGEVCRMNSPLRYGILPQALHVIVPRG